MRVLSLEVEGEQRAIHRWITPEKKLLGAILERAIRDYLSRDRVRASEARDWIFEQKISAEAATEFSFSWICEHLDIRKRELLRSVRKAKTRGGLPACYQKAAVDEFLEPRKQAA